jgi:hypothetical protein
MSFGSAVFKLAMELSPILLIDGIATYMAGGVLPIIALTEAAHFVAGLLSGTDNIELDNFFAHFQPVAGGTIISQTVGTYPFANQAVAGNAIIAKETHLSMLMICPARDEFGYATKLATMIALRATLAKHNSLGGTYTIVTPAAYYTGGIMLDMTDASNGASHQVQNAWQMDFTFPLITLDQTEGAVNSLMGKLTNGTQIDGQPAWSGMSNVVGASDSVTAPSIIPATAGLPAANTASFAGGLT